MFDSFIMLLLDRNSQQHEALIAQSNTFSFFLKQKPYSIIIIHTVNNIVCVYLWIKCNTELQPDEIHNVGSQSFETIEMLPSHD